jgi:hypothetical protein
MERKKIEMERNGEREREKEVKVSLGGTTKNHFKE